MTYVDMVEFLLMRGIKRNDFSTGVMMMIDFQLFDCSYQVQFDLCDWNDYVLAVVVVIVIVHNGSN